MKYLEVKKCYDEDSNSVWTGNSRILTQFDLTAISSISCLQVILVRI